MHALPPPSPAAEPRRAAPGMRQATLTGYAALGALFLTLFGWSTLANLGGAVIAAGQFEVESSIKKVQHQTGGLVKRIAVREGDRVSRDDVLVVLDDTVLRANVQVLLSQIGELRIRRARLEAERDRKDQLDLEEMRKIPAADPELQAILAAEIRLFTARKITRSTTLAQLDERIGQLGSEIEGTRQQLHARERESGFILRELEGVRTLYRQNLVQISRLSQLEREASALEGQRGALMAQIAQLEGRISESRLMIQQVDDGLLAEVLKELREVQPRLAELNERLVTAQDQLRRVEIRAPVSGTVHQLAIHTEGGTISAGEAIMQIVPDDEALSLVAKVSTSDFDQVQAGQAATVRVHAFNQRTTPELRGIVVRVASDVVREPQSGQAHFPIRVRIPPEELRRLEPFRIIAGMQADVFLETGHRTALSFLTRPLTDQVAKAFRER